MHAYKEKSMHVYPPVYIFNANMHAYTSTFLATLIHAFMHAYIHMATCTHKYIHSCLSVIYKHIYKHRTYMYVCIHTYRITDMCAGTNTYMCGYTHATCRNANIDMCVHM